MWEEQQGTSNKTQTNESGLTQVKWNEGKKKQTLTIVLNESCGGISFGHMQAANEPMVSYV